MAPLDRLERLTDLVLVLLDAKQPITLETIAREVPGYPEDRSARRQAFERDKRLLRDEGIPLTTEAVDGAEQFGYRIDPEAFYLSDLRLTPEEQGALHLAVAGVHLGDPSGRHALLKLGATGVTEARPVASFVPPPALIPLFEAVRSHALVRFGYRGEERAVAPGGLWFRGGRWYLVGWDQQRQAGRTFRVDRVDGLPTAEEPGSGQLPDGFDAEAAAPDDPWRAGEGEVDDVLLAVDAVEAPRVVAEVGDQSVEERHPDGSVVVRLGMTSSSAMRSWVLGLLDHAEVLGPVSMRDGMRQWLEAIEGQAPVTTTQAFGPDELVQAGARGDDEADGRSERAGGPTRDATERLRRLLAIVGWLANVGEAPMAEISQRFDITPEELSRELELAACCGLPPYSPDALMEIVVTDETVQAFLPDGLSRPRRLTAAEGFALATAARTILAVPGADADGALARALVKLEASLGDRPGLVVDLDAPDLLATVQQVTAQRDRVEIEYHSASSDETTQRVIDPLRVMTLDGHWYLDAYCHRAVGLRRFRVDRIRSVRVLGPQPDDAPAAPAMTAESFIPGPGAATVRLELGPAAAWVADSVPVSDVVAGDDGSSIVTLAVGGTAWLERLLLQVGPDARVVAPAELADVGRQAARRVLARYRG